MKWMSSSEIRKTWLDFFKSKEHIIISSASVVPINDNSLLWINSGIAALKKFFSGVDTPIHTRLTNSQICIRTNDIENVGVTSRHHTLFEMLGNFSIGNYFKNEALEFAFELLIKHFFIDKELLYITVFLEDDFTYNKWIDLGINQSHIIKNDKRRNFWDLGSGPCGPCTEIYYDRGEEYDKENKGFELLEKDIENDRYIELWNIVFSEFDNDGNGNYKKLLRKNIDTGAGLERLACISQNVPTNFETDLFFPTIKIIEANTKYIYNYLNNNIDNDKTVWFRIIVDHLRSIIFAICDGVMPSNKDRGYILRKLLRRIFIGLKILEVDNNIIKNIIESQINILGDTYPNLYDLSEKIYNIFLSEYKIFFNTLNASSLILKKLINDNKLNPKNLFSLVDTHGLPSELILSLENNQFEEFGLLLNLHAQEIEKFKNFNVDFNKFKRYFDEHKNISKRINNINSMDNQNEMLISLNMESEFIYDKNEMMASIINIMDENYKSTNVATNGTFFLILDKTPFYPTGGGQNHDLGTINGCEVVEVFKAPNGQPIHKVKIMDRVEIKVADLVNAKIDFLNRSKITAAHSAEHLLHQALKKIVDKNIKQEGSFKSSKKLTFDFFHNEKLSNEQLTNIESYVNSIIKSEINTEISFHSLDDAIKMGAIGLFTEKYKKIKGLLRVVKIGNVSIELCGGTHVKNTREIEKFLISKIEQKGSGLWRIESIVTEVNCFLYSKKILENGTAQVQEWLNEMKNNGISSNEFKLQLQEIPKILKSGSGFIRDFEIALKKSSKIFKKEMLKHKSLVNSEIILSIKNTFSKYKEHQECIIINNIDSKAVQTALSELVNEDDLKAFIILNICNDGIKYYAMQNKNRKTYDCFSLIKGFNSASNGKGGGRFNYAQGGTPNIESIDKLINVINERNMN
ncbi:MAG: alanine--tRNA ligase [Mycoplasmoidaceae bacterium]